MGKTSLFVVLLCVSGEAAFGQPVDDERILMRGDANSDGVVNGTDVTYLSNYLYLGGPAPPCMNQADANDDGSVNGSVSIYILNWLYQGGPAPPDPGPFNTICTTDGAPYPGCEVDPCD